MTARAAHEPGDVFGEWTLLEYVAGTTNPRREPRWLCRCACGVQREVQANNLLRSVSRSCGHDLAEKMSEGMRRYHERRAQQQVPVGRAEEASPWAVLSRYRRVQSASASTEEIT